MEARCVCKKKHGRRVKKIGRGQKVRESKLWILCLLAGCVLTGCNGTEVEMPQAQGQDWQVTENAVVEETLAEQLQVPEQVTEDFVSEKGICHLMVDADILMPKVSQVDIVEAIPRAFTEQEALQFVEQFQGEQQWKYVVSNDIYKGEGPEQSLQSGEIRYDLWIEPAETEQGHIKLQYSVNKNTGQPGWRPSMEYRNTDISMDSTETMYPLTEGKAQDCTISLEEAIALADAEVEQLAPNYRVAHYGQLGAWNGAKTARQFYILHYTGMLQGVPVNDTYAGDSYEVGQELITVILNDEGVCYLEYANPYGVGDILQRDVELLSFAEIWDIFTNVGMLKLEELEAYEEVIRNDVEIYEIRFGYMAVLQADGQLQYTPVWDFYGRGYLAGTGAWAHAEESEPLENDSFLTINAVTGTVIDRNVGY